MWFRMSFVWLIHPSSNHKRIDSLLLVGDNGDVGSLMHTNLVMLKTLHVDVESGDALRLYDGLLEEVCRYVGEEVVGQPRGETVFKLHQFTPQPRKYAG